MKIRDIESELYFLPFVIFAPIVTSLLFFYAGYWKIGSVIFIGHIIPVIMVFKGIFKAQKEKSKKN